MIQQIMVYAIAVAAALSVAGWGMERLAALQGRPRRSAWIVALLLSVLLPLLLVRRSEPVRIAEPLPVPVPAAAFVSAPATQLDTIVADMPSPRRTDTVSAAPQPEAVQRAVQPAPQPTRPRREWHVPQLSDRTLLQAWAIASLLSGLYLIGANLRLRRRIAGCQRAMLLGRDVLISDSMGPALVGALRPRMVVPRWLLGEPVTTQSLILEHERQHIAARDPLLIRAVVLLLAALPWNLPLWWQWRRLRQAIELDCDARVLRTGAEPQTYGEVLLSITGRATRMPSGVVAMSEPVSALERRIQNLLPDPVRHAALQATGAIALLAASVGAAVAMDAPMLPARVEPQTVTAQTATATRATISRPMTIEAASPIAPPSPLLLAAAAAATTDSSGMSPRDKALQAAVRRYPEMINGPAPSGPYMVTIALRADGTIYRSSLVNLNIIPANLRDSTTVVTGGASATYGSGAMAGVVNRVLNRRLEGLELSRDWSPRPSDGLVIEDPQTAKIPKGQQIAGMGTASNDIEVTWRVLPADYDESRDSRRVTEVVRAKHNDLMLAAPRTGTPQSNINLLTVFMSEDGQIARENVEILDNAQYKALNPQPANGESIGNTAGGPYNSYNPPPVPPDAFKVLGLDPAQIGQTGFLLVTRERADTESLRGLSLDQLIQESLPHQVLVRYAWPRRPGESIGGKTPAVAVPTAQRTQFVPTAPAPLPQAAAPIAPAESLQDLVQVSASDLVLAASWAKRTDAYVLQLVLDRSTPMPRREAATTDPTTSTNPITSLTREDMYRLGIRNMADDRAQQLQQGGSQNQQRAAEQMNRAREQMERDRQQTDSQRFGGLARDAEELAQRQNASERELNQSIANLRGMDPWLQCGRSLTLVDGRRVVRTGQPGQPEPAPAPTISYQNQPYPPEHKERRVDVWLLKADGSQILPATYSCEAGPISPPRGEPQHPVEVSYEFPVADSEQAVAVAVRIDDSYYIEKLQRPAPKPAAR